ncbi:hypothetical protein [Metabacillus sp. RGM 3146]|uniref:hypothetical protein n=1 Tax=Metabacillus sp. RGM 3146 TaxID=3401092 RepID=UPI003B9BBE1D
MDMCPLCNGFEVKWVECRGCGTLMEDSGRLTDYLDDYSAYMEIDSMKLYDGVLDSLEKHQCIHLFFCRRCQNEELTIERE